jgi:hypothetical protein
LARCSRGPIRAFTILIVAFTMTDLGVHHADPGVHDGAILVFTMHRSERSRWAETRILFEHRLHPALPDGAVEGGVVLLILVGVGRREGRQGSVEGVALAPVSAQPGG